MTRTNIGRYCSKCQTPYPASKFEYTEGKGYYTWCTPCRETEKKVCVGCNSEKPYKQFDRSEYTRFNDKCRKCLTGKEELEGVNDPEVDVQIGIRNDWLLFTLFNKMKKRVKNVDRNALESEIEDAGEYFEKYFDHKMNWNTYNKKWNFKYIKSINEKGISPEELNKRLHYTNIKPQLFKKYEINKNIKREKSDKQ